MTWYAAQTRELEFHELGDSLLDHPDAYEIAEVRHGVQAHRQEPHPVAWGYFPHRQAAYTAIAFREFPSDHEQEAS